MRLHVRTREAVSYTHPDAADDTPCVDLGGRRIIKKKPNQIFTYPSGLSEKTPLFSYVGLLMEEQ